MSDSWHTFFFASFDPGGALMIDKPPLGFWLQVGAVKLLGFHYRVLALPQALAGVAAVAVLFFMTRPRFGPRVATAAALMLAVMPASVASARNNSLDTVTMLLMLVSGRLLLRAVRAGSLRWLLLSALCAGLAFNTKMFAAFVPLPAFLLTYVVGRRGRVRAELSKPAIALVVLLVVSVSWVSVVSAIPGANRPHVYNGYGDNIWALTLGYNGLFRIVGFPGQQRVRSPGTDPVATALSAASGSPRPGPLRLFVGRLGGQVGWFLPAALLGAFALLRRDRRDPDRLFWSSWLVSGLVLFSAAGTVRSQYLEAITAPIALCAAVGLQSLLSLARIRRVLGGAAIVVVVGPAAYLLMTVDDTAALAIGVLAAAAAGVVVVASGRLAGPARAAQAAFAVGMVAALFVGPAWWSAATAAEPATGSATRYPIAGPDDVRSFPPAPGGDLPAVDGGASDPVLRYLTAHTQRSRFLVATERSLYGNAARYIVQTNRPVLTLDSFSGQANAAAILAKLVTEGALRFMELPPLGPWSDERTTLGRWFLTTCTDITSSDLQPQAGRHLYDCAPGPSPPCAEPPA